MLTQPDPSEVLRTSSPEDQLLAGVSPAVIEILGADRVLALEALTKGLEWFDGVLKTENPFHKPRIGEPDLSFMEPKQAGRIMGAYEARLLPEKVADHTSSSSLSRVGASLELTRLMILGDESQMALCRHLNKTVNRVDEVIDSAQEVITQTDGKMSIDQVVELSEHMNLLAECADQFPKDGTYEAIKAVLATAKEMLKARSGYNTPLTASLLQEVKALSAVAQILGMVDGAYDHQGALLRYGADAYERLKREMTRQKVSFTTDLLREVTRAKTFLEETSGGLDESQTEFGILAEEYICDKITEVEKILQELDPRVLKKPAVVAELQGLRTFKQSDAERERVAQHEEEVSRDLNLRVTMARDILRGGVRLKARNGDNPNDMTEKLKQFFKDVSFTDTERREHEVSGLIISMATGKFDMFTRTLEELKSEDTNGLVAIVARNRGAAIITELQEFDINGRMQTILSLIANPRNIQAIKNALTAGQFTKLELALEKYFEERDADDVLPESR